MNIEALKIVGDSWPIAVMVSGLATAAALVAIVRIGQRGATERTAMQIESENHKLKLIEHKKGMHE